MWTTPVDNWPSGPPRPGWSRWPGWSPPRPRCGRLAAWLTSADPAGGLIAAVATVGAGLAALFGTRARPRLRADADGVTVGGLLRSRHHPWPLGPGRARAAGAQAGTGELAAGARHGRRPTAASACTSSAGSTSPPTRRTSPRAWPACAPEAAMPARCTAIAARSAAVSRSQRGACTRARSGPGRTRARRRPTRRRRARRRGPPSRSPAPPADHQVEHDEGDDLAVGATQPQQHQQQAAHQPEHRAGRARHVLLGIGEQHDGRRNRRAARPGRARGTGRGRARSRDRAPAPTARTC